MNKQVNNESDCNKNLKVVNMEVPFEGWIPLTTIKTEADIEKKNKKGYQIGYTLNEFEVIYPSVDTSKIYFSNGQGFCYYFDNEKLIMLSLMLVEKTFVGKLPLDKYISKILKNWSKAAEKNSMEMYKETAKSLSGVLQLEYMKMVMDKMGLLEGGYELFLNFCNYRNFSGAISSYVKDVMQYKTPLEHQRTAENLEDFPDILTIYRVVDVKSVGEENSFYWPLYITSACCFNCFNSHGEKNVRVVQGSVKKTDIIECIYSTNGFVLIDPSNVYDVVECKQVNPKKVLALVDTCEIKYRRFKTYIESYDKHIKHLQSCEDIMCKEYLQSRENRIFKETLLTLFLAKEYGLNEKDVNSLCLLSDFCSTRMIFYDKLKEHCSSLELFLMDNLLRPGEDYHTKLKEHPELGESYDKVVLMLNILKDVELISCMDATIADLSELHLPMSQTLLYTSFFLDDYYTTSTINE